MEISDSDQMAANIRWSWRFCQSAGHKFRPVLLNNTVIWWGVSSDTLIDANPLSCWYGFDKLPSNGKRSAAPPCSSVQV